MKNSEFREAAFSDNEEDEDEAEAKGGKVELGDKVGSLHYRFDNPFNITLGYCGISPCYISKI